MRRLVRGWVGLLLAAPPYVALAWLGCAGAAAETSGCVVDRIEGAWVVVEVGVAEYVDVPRAELPGAREGQSVACPQAGVLDWGTGARPAQARH